MSHFGFLSHSAHGHLYPLTALARRLQQRGHQVTYFQVTDAERFIRAAGLRFYQIGAVDYPPGAMRQLLEPLSRLKGLAGLRYSVQELVCRESAMVLRDLPAAVRDAGVEALVVDQIEVAGGTVAEHLGLPFVTAIATLPINLDPTVPFVSFGWRHRSGMLGRLRNLLGNGFVDFIQKPVQRLINEQRRAWGLPPVRTIEEYFSRLGQIAQAPAEFDFPGRRLPPQFHYTGPFTDCDGRDRVDFPWERLEMRLPLVFASMGTLQNGLHHVFHTIAAACSGLGVQLVLSLGGGLEPEALGPLPGNTLLVRYAPQLELLRRAALTITHGGLNSALESLAQGVPMVCLPVTNDQPGVGARIQWSGTGQTIPVGKISVARLRAAIEEVLTNPRYGTRARALQSSIAAGNGLERAAELVEQACGLGPARDGFNSLRDVISTIPCHNPAGSSVPG